MSAFIDKNGEFEEAKPAKVSKLERVDDDDLTKGILAGNINMADKSQMMKLDDEVRQEQNRILAEFERKKKLRQIHITTDDDEIRELLRDRGMPVTLFGEGPADRRERLRDSISVLGPIRTKQEQEFEDKEAEELTKKTWYHEGPEVLEEMRYYIAEYAKERLKRRLKNEREFNCLPEAQKTLRLQKTHRFIQSCSSLSSQIGHDRPVSFCHISPNNKLLATASWSGVCKLWSLPKCKEVLTLRAHSINVGAIAFHPRSTISLDESSANLASCAADGEVKLWSLTSTEPVCLLGKHERRVPRLAFHPCGRFLGTACYDASWRLWDMEKQVELLHQEGHTKGVHDISFQCDGSLALTGGLDAYGRVWDLRTGRCIFFLEGHLKEIYSVCFSSNGYEMATGGADNAVKIWDIRKISCVYTIPAHTKLVSKLQYQKSRGNYLLTGSYDNTAKVWGTPGYLPLNTFAGHQGKIMGLDVSSDGEQIVTCSFDRTFKLWGKDEQSTIV